MNTMNQDRVMVTFHGRNCIGVSRRYGNADQTKLHEYMQLDIGSRIDGDVLEEGDSRIGMYFDNQGFDKTLYNTLLPLIISLQQRFPDYWINRFDKQGKLTYTTAPHACGLVRI